jgi:predicted transcriptional regulator of viral defense system
MMNHLGHPYYVGFLSAAALHGASHQASMVLQVVTSARLRDRKIGACRVQFIQRSNTPNQVCERMNVPTGRVNVSAPAVTVFDLVDNPRDGGGLSNVATVIGDLLVEGKLHPGALFEGAALFPIAVVQRVGYLVESMSRETSTALKLDDLALIIASADVTKLAPSLSSLGDRNERWRVQPNIRIEHDL